MTGVLIRKVIECVEDTLVEGGRAAPSPLRMAACAAVIRNPWAGSAFVEDLQPNIMEHAKVLTSTIVPRLVPAMGGPDRQEACGKCAVTGTGGEVEHADGRSQTLHLVNVRSER